MELADFKFKFTIAYAAYMQVNVKRPTTIVIDYRTSRLLMLEYPEDYFPTEFLQDPTKGDWFRGMHVREVEYSNSVKLER